MNKRTTQDYVNAFLADKEASYNLPVDIIRMLLTRPKSMRVDQYEDLVRIADAKGIR